MSGSEHARPVWLTKDQRDCIAALMPHGPVSAGKRAEIVAAWDAAPADPAEAIREAISTEWMNTGMGNEERIDDVYDPEGAAIYRTAAVLRALGMPS